ncbi:hypothetical protein D9757_001522 [Collybiopsis confluens]|uniref:Eukaryotic translation initiation factor 3 subunit L n=1 Tax=Collybiopsis confluens TaxID=2823264 RepID=A0A8H5MFV6_9AGAR|nr:hypothetical protein D9757_001522 [Collybiopsis confluens]
MDAIYTAYFALTPCWSLAEAPWVGEGGSLLRWIPLSPYVPSALDGQLSHSSTGEISYSPRALVLLALITVWMLRLSYNTYRRGLFSLTDEDYRWAVLRKQLPVWFFQVVNLTFISATQNVLLMGLGWPAYLAVIGVQVQGETHKVFVLTVTDYFFALWALGILLVEFTSDNQQFVYQTYKHMFQEAYKKSKSDADAHKQAISAANAVAWPMARPSPSSSSEPVSQTTLTSIHLTPAAARRGFITSGLWKYSRHPNFVCEQTFWWLISSIPVFATLGPDVLRFKHISPSFTTLHLWHFDPSTLFSLDTLRNLLGPSYAFAPSIALTILFLSSTAYTEDITRSKYSVAYGAYQKRVSMFGAVPLLGLIPAIIGVGVVSVPGTVFLPALIALRMGGGEVLENRGRNMLDVVDSKKWWFWLTASEKERKEVERIMDVHFLFLPAVVAFISSAQCFIRCNGRFPRGSLNAFIQSFSTMRRCPDEFVKHWFFCWSYRITIHGVFLPRISVPKYTPIHTTRSTIYIRGSSPPQDSKSKLETVTNLEKLLVMGLFLLATLSYLLCLESVVHSRSHSTRSLVVHESRREVPAQYDHEGSPHPDTVVNFRIGLASRDRNGLEKALYDVSLPSSPLYGKHLSMDEVKRYTSATSLSVAVVTDWLTENGIDGARLETTKVHDYLTFSAPVRAANHLLNTNFGSYLHTPSGKRAIRTLQYSIPEDLVSHISIVHPTTSFDLPVPLGLSVSSRNDDDDKRVARREPLEAGAELSKIDPSCANTITPQCLQDLYDIPKTPATQSSNRIAVPGLIEYWAQHADLQAFLERLRPDMPSNTTFSLETIDGGTNPQGPDKAGYEANLDTQYTVGIATGVNITFISAGPNNTDGAALGFLDVAEYLYNMTDPPQVMSMSYGYQEWWLTPSLAQHICDVYMALGARGTSLIFGSGDGGVSGAERSNTDSSQKGFSGYFLRPSYQEEAVTVFLDNLGDTFTGLYNASGRGFPDIAAQSHNVEIITGGETVYINGTSCSGPIFASMVALVNDRLIAAGRPPLGFLNPFLYKNPQIFTDITGGLPNAGCSTGGFNATIGWDPISLYLGELCHQPANPYQKYLIRTFNGILEPCLKNRSHYISGECLRLPFHENKDMVISDYFSALGKDDRPATGTAISHRPLGYVLTHTTPSASFIQIIHLLSRYAEWCRVSSAVLCTNTPTVVQMLYQLPNENVDDNISLYGFRSDGLKFSLSSSVSAGKGSGREDVRLTRIPALQSLCPRQLPTPTPVQRAHASAGIGYGRGESRVEPSAELFGTPWGHCGESITFPSMHKSLILGNPLGTLALSVKAMTSVIPGTNTIPVQAIPLLTNLESVLELLNVAGAMRSMCLNCLYVRNMVGNSVCDHAVAFSSAEGVAALHDNSLVYLLAAHAAGHREHYTTSVTRCANELRFSLLTLALLATPRLLSHIQLVQKMSRPSLWSTADMDEDLADAVDVELSMYAQQGQNSAVYDQLGAQIEQLEPLLAIQQHMAALAAVPDVFIVSFHQAILNRDLPAITMFYTTTFPKLTERFYLRAEWPEPEIIAPLLSSSAATEDQIHIFLVLYRDLYYRHVYSRLQPNIDDRFHSYENSCELFNYLLNSPSSSEDDSEPAPVDLVLPEQWLWDIIDEFIYQYQVFCAWRSKAKSKTDDELMMLADGASVWSSYSVLNVLYSLIQKSKINEFIVALREKQGKEGARTAEEIAESISPYTALPLYRTLGYFSVLGLLRVHVLLGDFTLGLKVMDQVGDFLLGGSGFGAKPNKSSLTALPTLPATHVSTHYYVGFCYMMLRRYPDAIRTFVTVLNFFQRMQRMRGYAGYERKDQYDQIAKTADRTLALYAMCHSLVLPGSPFTRLDDSITNTAKERYGEQMSRMSRGGADALSAFEELFLYACPKFINANSPPYNDPDAIANILNADPEEASEATDPTHRHLRLFLSSAAAQSPLPTLRSFLHLYTSLTTEKLTSFLDLAKISEPAKEDGEGDEAEEEAIQEMMVFKQSSRSLSRVVPVQGKTDKGKEASPLGVTIKGSLLEGDMISTSDLNFVIDDNTIHIAESTVGRRYAGWFIKNTERSQRVLDDIRASPLPKPTKHAAAGTTAPTDAQQPKKTTKTVAWGGAGARA